MPSKKTVAKNKKVSAKKVTIKTSKSASKNNFIKSVQKRDGTNVPFDIVKIVNAINKAMLAGSEGSVSDIQEVTQKERTLIKLILMFGATVEDARSEHLPHKLTSYLYELCQAFNSFYNSDEILTAAVEIRDFRLSLTKLTADVLKTGAELLTLRVPDRM